MRRLFFEIVRYFFPIDIDNFYWLVIFGSCDFVFFQVESDDNLVIYTNTEGILGNDIIE